MSFFNKRLKRSGVFEVVFNDKAANTRDLMLWHTEDYIRTMETAAKGVEVPDLFRYVSSDNVNPSTL